MPHELQPEGGDAGVLDAGLQPDARIGRWRRRRGLLRRRWRLLRVNAGNQRGDQDAPAQRQPHKLRTLS
jgi:hypothetical protein